jgi:hypothetical protein
MIEITEQYAVTISMVEYNSSACNELLAIYPIKPSVICEMLLAIKVKTRQTIEMRQTDYSHMKISTTHP